MWYETVAIALIFVLVVILAIACYIKNKEEKNNERKNGH